MSTERGMFHMSPPYHIKDEGDGTRAATHHLCMVAGGTLPAGRADQQGGKVNWYGPFDSEPSYQYPDAGWVMLKMFAPEGVESPGDALALRRAKFPRWLWWAIR